MILSFSPSSVFRLPLFFTFLCFRLQTGKTIRGCLFAVPEADQRVSPKGLGPILLVHCRWIAVPEGGTGRKLLCKDQGVQFVEAFLDRDLESLVHASADTRAARLPRPGNGFDTVQAKDSAT